MNMKAVKQGSDMVDPAALRSAMSQYATGVAVVTTLTADKKPAGLTITSFNSLSLDPPLVLWSLGLTSSNLTAFKFAQYFAINILSNDLAAIGIKFAKSRSDKFSGVPITPGSGGVPLIDGALVQLECMAEGQIPAGDHILFIGRVINLNMSQGTPLIFYKSDFGVLAGPC